MLQVNHAAGGKKDSIDIVPPPVSNKLQQPIKVVDRSKPNHQADHRQAFQRKKTELHKQNSPILHSVKEQQQSSPRQAPHSIKEKKAPSPSREDRNNLAEIHKRIREEK